MCGKPDFEKAQNAATRLLLKQNLDSLFIDVRNFSFGDRKILIDSVQNYASITNRNLSDFTCDEFSGCCVIPYSRCNLVLYDDFEQNEARKHWGIAHELGHIYLDHQTDGEKEEKEAHFFAAQIVTPEIVLLNLSDRCHGINPDMLYGICNVSYESACKRIGTFQRRCGFSSSLEDQMLLAKFRPILDRDFPRENQKQFWDRLCTA